MNPYNTAVDPHEPKLDARIPCRGLGFIGSGGIAGMGSSAAFARWKTSQLEQAAASDYADASRALQAINAAVANGECG